MDPSDGATADVDEDPVAFTRLGKHGRPKTEHRQDRFVRRRPGPKIHAGRLNQLDAPIALDEIRFVEDRLGGSTCPVNEEESDAKSIFFDLTFGLFEFGSRHRDVIRSPRRGGRCPFDLDACHRDGGNGSRSGMCRGKTRLCFDERGLGHLEVGMKPFDLLQELRRAFGLCLSKELGLFEVDDDFRARTSFGIE